MQPEERVVAGPQQQEPQPGDEHEADGELVLGLHAPHVQHGRRDERDRDLRAAGPQRDPPRARERRRDGQEREHHGQREGDRREAVLAAEDL